MSTRPASPVDAVADSHVDGLLALSPSLATYLGVPGAEGLDDYSPEGIAALDDLNRRTLESLAGTRATDEIDTVTVAAMQERLGIERELHAAGLDIGTLNVIASPVQDIRDSFDLLPTASAEDWERIAHKLSCVPEALAGYRRSLTAARAAGGGPARRQVIEVAEQAETLAGPESSLAKLVAGAEAAAAGAGATGTGAPATGGAGELSLPESLLGELRSGLAAAAGAYGDLAEFLENDIAPAARENEACGREAYLLHSRYFLGAEIDPEETYDWALEELARIDAEQTEVCARILPGADLHTVMKHLDADPARTLHGAEALREWMQEVADTATAELAGTQFDIPAAIRTIECCIAPSGTGGIYYTAPTADLSRPGRMWWAVPPGVETFATWQEKTTVYHEGVPGHHLQIGQTVVNQESLNRWRRLICWVSGHGEGWALYAERLMADLGYLDEDGDRLGMLDSQRLRAARVVLDIGFHLGLAAPQSLGGGTWDREKAWQFLLDNVAMDRSFLAFELSRYLGWPGQAPSYKIGQRLWEDIRDTSRARAAAAGEVFDLKDFHRRALDIGSVGLDVLRSALL